MEAYLLEHPKARALAYRLLAGAAVEFWGLSQLPAMERGEHGKPFFPQHPDFHFNISHSGSLALCVLDSAPVGADIQVVRPPRRPALLGEVCNPEQRDWLRRQGDTPEAFTLLWSMKESRCKWSGTGLRRPISSIPVPLPQPGEDHLTLDGLHFYLRSGPGWQICLCGSGQWDGNLHQIQGTDKEE